MFKSYLRCVEGCVKASGRRMSGHHDHRTFAVTSVKRLIQVSLFCLCRNTCRRACTLHIHNHERKFRHDGKAERLRLEGEARTGSRGHGEVAGKCGTDSRTYARDLILCLKGLCSEALVNRKFLEDSGSRSDRIRSAEKRKIGLLRSCEETPCRSLVSCYVPVKSCWLMSRFDIICIRDSLNVCGVIVSVLEDLLVRFYKFRLLLAELTFKILEYISTGSSPSFYTPRALSAGWAAG